MQISLKWLNDYVQCPPGEELARRLTMAGLEIEGFTRLGQGLEGVVVALIKESSQHPNADKLSVTQVDAGANGVLQVVCGAKNYQVGDKVPLATVGSKLPNGMAIKKAALRGVDSSGMLCSARELGLSEDAAGLMILDPSLPVGMPIVSALGLDDTLLEVNVTPNRPDALSHLGIAREVAALTGQPVRYPAPAVPESGRKIEDLAQVRIEAEDRCPRYAARVVEGVKVGPSPQWLQDRLKACGVRSINNLVDVTNYVLLEWGHPLHAFDLEKLAGGTVVVRTARKGETLKTLDGKERPLDADDLVIADAERAQAIAGVMGGGDSEVTEGTTRVLLESAWFLPSTVRRSSKRHGLHTEASHRFERGTDIDAVPRALDRAAALVAELCGGSVARGVIDEYPGKGEKKTVRLRTGAVSRLLGTEVPEAEVAKILTALGFTHAAGASSELWQVPSFRVDVDREEDLIEEVARIWGYDRIPSVLPRGPKDIVPEAPEMQVERRVREALAGAGMMEIVSYAFVTPQDLPWTTIREYEALGSEVDAIAVQNPLSVEQSAMRTSLYAGLLRTLSHNLRHAAAETVRLYEWGRSYHKDPEGGENHRPVAKEVLRVAGVLHGLRLGRHWTASDARLDFFDAKGAVEAVLAQLGIDKARFVPAELSPYHPRACAKVWLENGVTLGTVGELHPRTARALDLPEGIFLFDLEVDRLRRAGVLKPRYEALTRFPSVLRDLAVVVDAALTSEEVRKVILDAGGDLVDDARVFDVYAGKPIPEGRKNLAFALSYRASDRTLTDVEVNEAHQRIVAEVNRRLGGSLRGENAQ